MAKKVKTEAGADFAAMSRLYADIDLAAEGKACGFLRVPHSVHRSAYGWIPIPIVRIANGHGPRVVLIGGNHGDEWEGQIALAKLIRRLEPHNVRGRLVVVPSANFPAAIAATRTSPIDGGNLNRAFPGDKDGDITHQIAYWLENVLMPGNDFAIDLHSGGSSLMYMPSALMVRDEDAAYNKRCHGLLEAFGAPVSYIVDAPQGGGRTFGSRLPASRRCCHRYRARRRRRAQPGNTRRRRGWASARAGAYWPAARHRHPQAAQDAGDRTGWR